ncbi:hypothetical protein BKK47_03400 [Rodentibacter mrazii]|uniref:Uncharacterized protein n=1 Tax=Rodentibacter mrazii TaxID=1908257 RepID=A0A1V3III4_9PAST|nr:hypothetical protein [Rodentibacter mrazii]OOF40664.1 hypothetical protein BKK47_03400 [Rodentibacter mrazii]
MNIVQTKEEAVEDFKNDCIKTCNEIQEVVNAWIKRNKKDKSSLLYKSNINVADFKCWSVSYSLDQDGSEVFIIYCDEGDDNTLSYEISLMAIRQLGVECACIMNW